MNRVQIVRGVIGEDRAQWLPGEVHDASPAFASWLVSRGMATPDGEDEKPMPRSGLTSADMIVNPDHKPTSRRGRK